MTVDDIAKIIQAVESTNGSQYGPAVLVASTIAALFIGYIIVYLKEKGKEHAANEGHSNALNRLSDNLEAQHSIQQRYDALNWSSKYRFEALGESLREILRHLYIAKEASRELLDTFIYEEELTNGMIQTNRIPMTDEAWRAFSVKQENRIKVSQEAIDQNIGPASIYLDDDSLEAIKSVESCKVINGVDFHEYLDSVATSYKQAYLAVLENTRKLVEINLVPYRAKQQGSTGKCP